MDVIAQIVRVGLIGPVMGELDDAGENIVCHVSLDPDSAPGRGDLHRVARLEAPGLGVVGVDLEERVGHHPAQSIQVPVLGMEEADDPRAGGEHQGIRASQIRPAHGALHGLLVDGERAETMLLQDGGPDLNLARGGREPRLLVMSGLPDGDGAVYPCGFLLEVLHGEPRGFQDVVEALHYVSVPELVSEAQPLG